jgi:hypothetical protein
LLAAYDAHLQACFQSQRIFPRKQSSSSSKYTSTNICSKHSIKSRNNTFNLACHLRRNTKTHIFQTVPTPPHPSCSSIKWFSSLPKNIYIIFQPLLLAFDWHYVGTINHLGYTNVKLDVSIPKSTTKPILTKGTDQWFCPSKQKAL